MMQWLRGIQKRTQRLTLEVVAAARDAAWQRTEQQISGMTTAEARGYARARARMVVTRSTDSILEQDGISVSAKTRDHVIASALEAIVDWVVQQRQQPALAPVRRAA